MTLAGAAALLAAFGVIPAWPGVTHIVALPPLDLVHDVGALLVFTVDLPTFGLGLVAVIGARAALLATVLGGLTRERFLFAVRFYALVLVPVLVAAGLLYASMALLFYALFWAGVAITLPVTVTTAALPWAGSLRLRTAARTSGRAWGRAGTVGAYLACLFVVGWLADVTGRPGIVVLTPVSALLTVTAARSLAADPGWRLVRRVAAAAPALLVVALVAVVVTGPAGPAPADGAAREQPGSVMLMSGIDSSSGSGAMLEIDPQRMGWPCSRTYYFSYAGPGEGQPRNDARCPIRTGAPYQPVDTLRSRDQLIPFLAEQVASMEVPPVILGHSQGAWLVWQAAADGRLPTESVIVLIGPFPENPVAFPEAGERGRGGGGRWILRLVAEAPRPGGTTAFEVDSPLGREWLGDRDAIADTLARPLPGGVRALVVASAFDLPLMTGAQRIEGATHACPVAVIHPNLPYAAELQEQVAAFVAGDELAPCPRWREAVGSLFRHFAVPPSHW
jgi:hypothetical protein